MSFALVTGASSGLGKEFTYLLAEKGYNVVLVARSEDKLLEIKKDIQDKYRVRAIVIAMDLSVMNSAELLLETIQKQKIFIDVLINNAGFGKFGNFLQYDAKTYEKMIFLNTVTVTSLVRLFGNGMVKKGKGKILNVSSTAAFQSLPHFSVYAATKSYVLSLSEAVHYEFRDSGVTVTVLCPGPTATNFGVTAGTRGTKMFNPGGMMDARVVAREGLKGLFKGDMVVVPGKFNKFLAFFAKHLPVKIVMFIANRAIN